MSDGALKKDIPGACPDPLQLGRSGWDILHSSAAVYPYKPSAQQREAMLGFITGWAHVYACSWCAYHMRQYVQAHPPQVEDKLSATRYVCELHNEVNARLGKDRFDCDPMNVLRRWHPGFPNKMEDRPTMEEKIAEEQRRAAAAKEQQRRQEAAAAEEARLMAVSGGARRAASQWRNGVRPDEGEEAGRPNHSSSGTAPQETGRRWWFFGGTAYDGKSSSGADATSAPGGSATAAKSNPPPQQQQQQQQSSEGQQRRGKAADSETDVDAVLARLRGCQVYCPEDEEVAGAKKLF